MQSSCVMELWGFNCISFDEKTSDASDVGTCKQVTALSGQGRWSLVTAQEQDLHSAVVPQETVRHEEMLPPCGHVM